MRKQWYWLKFYFSLFFLSKQCKSVTLKCIGGADFRPRIFFKFDRHHLFKSLFCKLHEVSYKIRKNKPISKGPFLVLNARSPFTAPNSGGALLCWPVYISGQPAHLVFTLNWLYKFANSPSETSVTNKITFMSCSFMSVRCHKWRLKTSKQCRVWTSCLF